MRRVYRAIREATESLVEGSYDAVQQHHDQIDVVFANVGGGEFASLGAITEEHFDKTFATNVKGVLFTVQKALPLMRDGGSVILTSSTTRTTGTPAFSVCRRDQRGGAQFRTQLGARPQGPSHPGHR